VVKILKRKDKVLYVCKECGFVYEERMWAEKCEDFCGKYHSCSLEITSHAVKQNEDTEKPI
jgi:predicted ATP-dependent serine protease